MFAVSPLDQRALFTQGEAADERAEIERRAKADGTWLKAPNGKPTKLTPHQWVQVRTRRFKEWFGDWEAPANIIRALKAPVISIQRAVPPATNADKRREAQRIARAITTKHDDSAPLINVDTGKRIRVSVGGAQHAANFTGDARRWSLLANIEDILARALFIRSEALDPRKAADTNLRAYHKFLLPVSIGGEFLFAKITVREDANGNWFFDAALIKTERPADVSTGLATLAGDQTPDIQRASSVIAQDGFGINPDSVSKVVDENGEPLVMWNASKTKVDVYRPHSWFALDRRDSLAFGEPQPFFIRLTNAVNNSGGEVPGGNSFTPSKGEPDGTWRFHAKRHLRPVLIAYHGGDQIKSATANSGEFSPDNPSILRSQPENIERRAKADGTWLKAPNGKPTKLTPHQWVQVRTRRFKEWFGDWEALASENEGTSSVNPATVSKVVDKNGEPLVVTRGQRGAVDDTPFPSDGIHFSSDPSYAAQYASSGLGSPLNKGFDDPFVAGRYAYDEWLDGTTTDAWLAMWNPIDFREIYDGQAITQRRILDWLASKGVPLDTPFPNTGGGRIKATTIRELLGENSDAELNDFSPNESITDDAGGFFRQLGFDGIIFPEHGDMDSISFVVYARHQIKSATANSGEFSPDNPSILRSQSITPEQDAAYLDAVQRGDMEAAQRMVNGAAKAAGYENEAFKGWVPYTGDWADTIGFQADQSRNGIKTPITVIGRKSKFPTFIPEEPDLDGIAGFFSNEREVADRFAFGLDGITSRFYLRSDRPLVIDAEGQAAGKLQFERGDARFRDGVRSKKYDVIILKNTKDEGDVWVMLDSNHIKSADPVTYDDNGNVIPLSRRFDPQSDSILRTQPDTFAELLKQSGVDLDALDAAQEQAASEAAPNRKTGNPDLAFGAGFGAYGVPEPGDPVIMGVDAYRAATMNPQTFAQWDQLARNIVETDYAGALRHVVNYGLAVGNVQLDAVWTRVAQIIMEREARLPLTPERVRTMQAIAWAYREAGTIQARGLAARRDPFKSPAERNREFLAKAILTPPPDVRGKIEQAPTPEAKQNLIYQKHYYKSIARSQFQSTLHSYAITPPLSSCTGSSDAGSCHQPHCQSGLLVR